MMKLAFNATLVGCAALLSSACQTVPYQGVARDVKRKPSVGGTIGVPLNPRQEDRARANERMISNCGSGSFKITEENEVITGKITQADARNSYRPRTQQQSGTFFGMPVYLGDPAGNDASTVQTRTQMKEWQISYECTP